MATLKFTKLYDFPLKVTGLFLTTVLLSFYFILFILFFVVFLLIDRRDSQGTSAISYIVRATSHLLDPRAPEFTASFVGRLVTTLIKNVRKQDFAAVVALSATQIDLFCNFVDDESTFHFFHL